MLSVSSAFAAAEKADANQVASKIYLLLGNYASASAYGATASASSTDSGDYPASGAIDGDRTEINVGPASGADNDVGQSSWRSSTAPSVTPQTLTVNFGQTRTINRIKLYHLSSHALKSYKLESSPDNSTWTLIDKTTDQGGGIATTNQVDTVDFTDVACQYVRLTVADTVSAADKANVVEIECYRKVDISDRVISAKVNRSRDYKLQNPLAATFQIACDNSDRFFSFSYSPTAAEVSSGFVNSELKPNLGIIVKYGFAYGGGTPELATVFNGFIDRLQASPGNRTAIIEGRDNMKPLINQIVASKLKTSQDVKACIQYALNLANISNWEMSLDTTSLTIDYFFINTQSILTVIRDLVAASADAAFYFDESGIATFKYYVNSTPQSHTDSSESDFEAGALTNIDTTSDPGKIGRKWFLVDDFSDGNFNTNPMWTNRIATQSHVDTTEADFEAGTVKTNLDTTSVPDQFGRKWFLIDDFADGDFNSNPAWGIIDVANPTIASTWAVTSNMLRHTQPHDPSIVDNQTISTPGVFSPSVLPLTGTWRMRSRFNNAGNKSGAANMVFFCGSFFQGPGSSRTDGGPRNAYYVSVDRFDQKLAIRKIAADGTDTLLNSGSITLPQSDTNFHSVRVTKNAAGSMAAYFDEVLITSTGDTAFVTNSYFMINAGSLPDDTIDFDDIYYSPALDGTGAISTSQTVFESQVIDQSAQVTVEGLFNATYNVPAGCAISFFTATSDDNISYDAYVAATPGVAIASTTRRYLKWKAVLTTPNDNGTNNNFTTPTVQDVTIIWTDAGWQVVSSALKYAPGTGTAIVGIDTMLAPAVGTWRANFNMTVGNASGEKARMYFLTTGFDATTQTYLSGYYVELDQAAGKIRLGKITAAGVRSALVETAVTITTAVTYSVRATRTSAGLMEIFFNEVSKGSTTDTTFVATSVIAFEVDPNGDQNGSTVIDDVYFSPAIDGTGAITAAQAAFVSAAIDMTGSVTSLGIFQATDNLPSGTSLAFYTATSGDNVTYDAYVAVTVGGAIGSAVKRYLKWKVVMTCPIDDGAHNAVLTTPQVFDVTVNWFTGTGSAKYPTAVSYVFRFDSQLLGLSQEYSDNMGGDSAIINDVNVQAKPTYLSGTDADTQWQGTVGTPPVAISGSNPLSVSNGTLTYQLIIAGGMDTAHMSGGSPTAAVVTFGGGAVGTWVFSKIHPTRPTLVITITNPGTITDLRAVGKAFSSSTTGAVQNSQDATSIKLYGDRQVSVSNAYIVNSTIAASIASKLVANYKNPTSYIPSATVRPTFSAQLNDRVTVVDDNTGLNADYVIAGIQHQLTADVAGATAQTDLLLLKVV